MKRMKKVFAMLLAFAMVMAMSLTTFAAEVEDASKGLDIPVTNADDAEFKNAQLIMIDDETETGWAFVNDDVEKIYVETLGVANGQEAIWKLIKKVSGTTVVPGMPEGTEAAEDSDIAAALRRIKESNPAVVTLVDGKKVYAPGVYFLDAEEEGYTYNAMAAYVSFGAYTNGVPSGLECDGIQAKKADTEIGKTNDNGDAVTEIGRDVTYTITSTVPYIAADNTGNYTITDTISGATYNDVLDGFVTVMVKVGDGEPTEKQAELNNATSWTLDLSDITTNNVNAGKTLLITYSAKVTDMVVHNNVVTNDGDHSASEDNYLYAGSATITKVDVNNTALKLDGAEFVVKKVENEKVTYATFTENKEENIVVSYTLSGWVTDIDDATHIVTGTNVNGEATVKGLDSSETYFFVEVVAPTGYSVNEEPEAIIWAEETETKDGVEVTTATGTATMLDTKLSALPSTGGIGTAVFTIGGCAIMVAAAYFFLASRKKES